MRLKAVELNAPPRALPPRVNELLNDADQRIERLQHERRDRPIAAFVPSDFATAYHALDEIDELGLAPGRRFVEWGSGAGVVACLAAMLAWDAVGIEIEDDLVDLAEGLAEDHDVAVEFVRGSFVPEDCHADLAEQRDINWLRTDGADAYEWLGLDPDDFDLVFAYPWPGEEQIVFDLFAESGAVGSLLLTYHGQEGLRLQRKVP
ncbi:MAG: hypothetical protein AAGB00_03185 [Planctomycetota bacterium]